MAGYRIIRNTIGMSVIAMAITAIPVAWLFGTRVTFGDFLSGFLLVASIGTLVAAMMLWISLISWKLTVWPIAIGQRDGACIVRLAGRKPWSWMQDLSPMLAVGELDFVHSINSKKPMKADSLPRGLSRCRHAVWLRLAWQRRVRWVILDMHKNEEDALVGMAEWADRLGINLEKSVHSNPAPRLAYLYRDVKLF